MKVVDLNVLLYAINQDAPHHARLKSWWESALVGDEPIGLPWFVLLGFLRLATNPRVFSQPLAVEQAIAKMDSWLAQPVTRVLRETEDHWRLLSDIVRETGTAGNLTTDAHLAAFAITHGAVLVSCDADFSRFPKLRWENPLAPR